MQLPSLKSVYWWILCIKTKMYNHSPCVLHVLQIWSSLTSAWDHTILFMPLSFRRRFIVEYCMLCHPYSCGYIMSVMQLPSLKSAYWWILCIKLKRNLILHVLQLCYLSPLLISIQHCPCYCLPWRRSIGECCVLNLLLVTYHTKRNVNIKIEHCNFPFN